MGPIHPTGHCSLSSIRIDNKRKIDAQAQDGEGTKKAKATNKENVRPVNQSISPPERPEI